MVVDGDDFYVKGFTWSHCPVGMKHDYDLFGENEADIKAALKRDMSLIQKTGGNTIRGVVPKQWMKYIHETYGIHFISNDHCGRYGLEIDGKFVSKINYADPAAREVVKQNDWDNNSPGGYDLTGAKTISFWARGHEGGEKVKISLGGTLTGKYPNTCSAEFGEIVLTKEWKEHSFSVEGKDLRRIKNPFTVVVSGNGFPFRFYLDDVSYK